MGLVLGRTRFDDGFLLYESRTKGACLRQAQLVSLEAVDIEPIPSSISVDMNLLVENHRCYLRLTPKASGGSHVMIQY